MNSEPDTNALALDRTALANERMTLAKTQSTPRKNLCGPGVLARDNDLSHASSGSGLARH